MQGFFDGIGQWAATFGCQDVLAGQVVKFSGEGRVSSCAAGEDFCGYVVSVGRDGAACSVALGGIVSASFSGEAPAVGWCGLAADGKGGVSAASTGRAYRVTGVDAEQGSVTFVL